MSHSTAEDSGQSSLYQRAPCGLLTIDGHGTILSMNRAMAEILGIEDDASPKRFHDMLRTGDRIYWETHVAPLLDMQGRVAEIAMELVIGDVRVPVLLNASRVEAEPGTLDLAVLKAHDRRSYERELLNARKHAEEAEERARQLATTLQRSLFPPSLPHIDGVRLGAAYRPAGGGAEVGGDFYDVFRLTASEWMVVIGDVGGKGPDAAALTGLTRYTIRGAAMETHDLGQIVAGVNRALMEDRAQRTATALLSKLSPGSPGPEITVCAAGHPLPRLVAADGSVTLVGRPGTLLGAFAETRTATEKVLLAEGASLVMFTDGVTDARSDGEFFGEGRLHAQLASSSGLGAAEMATRLADACLDFQDGVARDDVAVVVVQSDAF